MAKLAKTAPQTTPNAPITPLVYWQLPLWKLLVPVVFVTVSVRKRRNRLALLGRGRDKLNG